MLGASARRRPAADADCRLRVPAALAAQRDVPDEALGRDARSTKQELPRNVGDAPAAGAGDAQMRVALALRFGDRAGAPVRIAFHVPAMIAREVDRSQARGFRHTVRGINGGMKGRWIAKYLTI
jgi:hypothetical protein